MRASKMYLHTLKEVPSDIEKTSEKFLIRAGMMRKFGGTAYLPLGYRVIEKIKKICKEVLDQESFQEMLMLNQSNEEAYVNLVKKDLKSYKELPFSFYQIQTKYKDELSNKPSIILDGVTFDKDIEEINKSFLDMHKTLEKIYKKCGLNAEKIADIHNEEENLSFKFVVVSDEGNEDIAFCKECDYKATMKYAKCIVDLPEQDLEMHELEEVYTPNVKTIEELNQFLDVPEDRLIKCLLLKGKEKFVAAFVRGDRELNLAKLENVLDLSPMELSFAESEDVEKITGAKTGFAGPIGLKHVIKVVDDEVTQMRNAIAGANKTDYHIKNVNYERDFKADCIADIKKIKEGDPCPNCSGKIKIQKAIEVGKIEKIKKPLGATFIDESGKEKAVKMNKFTIDITKTLSAIVNEKHDDDGLLWSMDTAPFHVILSVVNVKNEEQMSMGERLYHELLASSIEVLLDDRDERAGVKFKDADLLGIPIRITIGKKASEGIVEYKLRNQEDKEELKYNQALSNVLKTLKKTGIM